MSKITAVGPGGACPRFHAFLDRIMDGDDELIAFLQRWFGYCLSGNTGEQKFVFCYGTGANGKGRLLHAVTALLSAAPRQ